MTISAVILSGGRAKRMGGIDKGLVMLRQKPLIQHVIQRIQPQVCELFINANRELTTYQSLGLPVFTDAHDDFIGPLAGFYVGLLHAKYPYLLTVPCDVPDIPDDIASRLLAALTKQDADIVVAKTDGHTHPVVSLCKTTLLPSLTQAIAQGERKVSAWQKSRHYIEVSFDDCRDAFTNLNTLGDVVLLEQSHDR
jgi:molybdopterin-guanine dinucleotide biosynthesis protein A